MQLQSLAFPPQADRILVIRLGALGDVARTLPAASALRLAFPGAHIAWLVEPASGSLVVGQPWIDEAIEFPRERLHAALRAGAWIRLARELRRFVRGLRGRRFELVLDFHSILRSGVLSRLTGAPERVAYAPPFAREFAHVFANRWARLAPERISRFARNAALVRYLGVAGEPARRPLRVTAATPALRAVALHPGSSAATPYKRYGVAEFAVVARALAADTGTPCLVTRGPDAGEEALACALVAAAGDAARLAPRTSSAAELAALFAGCAVVIAGDTGPLHLAALAGTPVVQLLGPTDPVENAPWEGTPARTLRRGLACSPCRSGCAEAPCMGAIAPSDVVAAARELLAAPPRRPAAGGA